MSLARSRPKVGMGYFGPVPPEVWAVVATAWEQSIAVSSNIAREYAPFVALAASLGWISTVASDGLTYTRTWNATAEGVYALKHKEHY